MSHSIAKIDNNLFLGSFVSVNSEILQELNITYIFHLGFEISDQILNHEYFKKYCKHEYFDINDDSISVNKMLKISNYIVSKIDELLNIENILDDTKNIENVLVCCPTGKSRSASMIALYLHYKYPKLSYEEIINNKINNVQSISINKTFAEAIRIKIANEINGKFKIE